MSVAVRDLRRTAWEGADAATVAAIGTGLLLLRAFVHGGAVPLAFLGIYAALFVLSYSMAVPAEEASPLGRTAVLGVGVAAVGLVALIGGPRIPLAAGPVALGLNVAAAVSEEAFFRRFLYGRLVGLGVPAAIAGSALLFALVHVPLYGWVAFGVDLGAGLVLSWQRWASGGWAAPAATHVVADVLAVLR